MFSNEEIINMVNKLNVNFDKFSYPELVTGINIELEHGKVNSKTNVTDDDLEKTMKIALAHLNEYPNYYNKDYGLLIFEDFLKTKNKE